MKKILPITAALVLALVGCSSAPEAAKEEVAEEPAAVEQTAEEETTDEGEQIDWTDAKSAEEAAKGAGFEKFGVINSFKLSDMEFKDPSFAYAGSVAQATYDQPACAVYLRKGVGTYYVPLSDRMLDEFPAKWHKVYEGIDVACYGPAKGAITVATWSDGDKSYGLTFQGLGGEEMSMDTDELHSLVKGINEANGDTKAEEKKEEKKEETKTEEKKEDTSSQQQSQQQSQQKQSSLISEKDAEALVEKTCGGTCTAIDRVTTKQYGECWYATAADANGNRFEYYVTNDGIYLIDEKGVENTTTSSQEKKATNGEHYEGEPVSIFGSIYAEWHQMNDGSWYAVFITYNGTQIFAQPAPAGSGWAFTAFADGTTYPVVYSEESSNYGEVGPGGVSSHWQASDGSGRWF